MLHNLQTVDGTYVVNQSTMLSYLLLYLNCEENIKFTEIMCMYKGIMCMYKGIMFSHLIRHKKVVLFHESGFFNPYRTNVENRVSS